MAVVQISRIQVRRGRAQSGTGFPQLASGEMGWAIDTQELYIGNGAVSEGSPAVGNTKILTELDLTSNGSFLDLINYTYRVDDTGIQTGPGANSPIERTLQQRFDDRVTLFNFGGANNNTADNGALQRAINQLFLNSNITKASATTVAGVQNRVTLVIPQGTYNLATTLFIPSYATIVGAGSNKTIINYTGNAANPAIRFVNDLSVDGTPSTITSTLGTNQPRDILLAGLTINTANATGVCLQLDAVKDSKFDDLNLSSTWSGTFSATNRAIWLRAVSAIVTCDRNVFNNIAISNFNYGVYAKQDILNNTFTNGTITNMRQGFILGGDNAASDGADLGEVGEQYGPRQTQISNFRFNNIRRHAIYLYAGTGNTFDNIKLDNVGNNSGNHEHAAWPQIYLGSNDNIATNVLSDRSYGKDNIGNMATPIPAVAAVPFFPEVTGVGEYSSYSTQQITLGEISSYTLAFRLPVSMGSNSNPSGSIEYNINYMYRSIAIGFVRTGKFRIVADIDNGTINYSDDYDTTGIGELESLQLDFKIVLLDEIGAAYTGIGGQIPFSIAVTYKNTLNGDSGVLNYSYDSSFTLSI